VLLSHIDCFWKHSGVTSLHYFTRSLPNTSKKKFKKIQCASSEGDHRPLTRCCQTSSRQPITGKRPLRKNVGNYSALTVSGAMMILIDEFCFSECGEIKMCSFDKLQLPSSTISESDRMVRVRFSDMLCLGRNLLTIFPAIWWRIMHCNQYVFVNLTSWFFAYLMVQGLCPLGLIMVRHLLIRKLIGLEGHCDQLLYTKRFPKLGNRFTSILGFLLVDQ